ncbi:MAG: copper chaperone PCu(A)C [Alphaproteobacteria bacterium]|nr:copper chaperone PCu(A)C [Alphaproteobacteria bacterium]
MNRLLAATLLSLVSSPVLACDAVQLGTIEVEQAWSRASIGTSRPGVVYLTIRNAGTEDDALVSIDTPISGMPMLHETVVTDGIASMPHAMEVPVPADATVALEPGGYHGMLMDLTQVLKEGESFPVTLTFRNAGEVTVPVSVQGVGATDAGCSENNG